MESWRLVWRKGFVPVLQTKGLEALAGALRGDDPRLTQGSTTPPPLMCVQDWPCEAADALGFAGWQGSELTTVGEVEEFFARACFDADQRMGEPAACRWFLNWFDDTSRDEMRRELLAEVELALTERDDAVKQTFPVNSVVVRVRRGAFPVPFSKNTDYDEADDPYQRVDHYNLVIVPSGPVLARLDKIDVFAYASVWAGGSGRMYAWADYYRGEYGRRSVDVGGPTCLVECLPNKDHHKAPRDVNVYASTAGVVWLALRTVLGTTGDLGRDAQRLVAMDDAPFVTYIDLLDELEGSDSVRDGLRDRLKLFFGLTEE